VSVEGNSLMSPRQDPSQPSRRFQFGVWEVDSSAVEVRKQGSRIKIQDKPFQLLVLLLEHAGKVITREEMRRGLWPADTFVNFDANLKTTVNKLRQILGDSAGSPIFIETIPRQGYRFLPPVVNLESRPLTAGLEISPRLPIRANPSDIPAEAPKAGRRLLRHIAFWAVAGFAVLVLSIYVFRARPRPVHAPALHRVVLLVLPFENLSGDPAQEYFSDGLTDEMITLLGRQYPRELAVIARTSAMSYRGTQKPLSQVAHELGGVEFVLEGSVRRSGGRVSINAQLFRSQDQASLWAETYEREVADLLAIQHDVAGRIASSLVLEVVPDRTRHVTHVPDSRIYDAYLMGMYEANKRSEASLRKSIEYFQMAIQGDPEYAPPYAGLANSYLLSAGWLNMSPADAYPKAKAAALRALALDENLAEAHTTLAEEEHEYEWKWAEAEGEFRQAIGLDPNSPVAHKSYAEFLMHGGRGKEAIAEMERARDLDPLSLIASTLVGFAYHNAREYDRAIEEYAKVIQLDPRFAPAHYFLGASLAQEGRYDEAIAHLQTAKGLSQGASLMTAGLARAYAVAGRRDRALAELRELHQRAVHRYVSPYGFAQVYAALGDNSAALQMLDRAAAEHVFELMFLKVDRSFDHLRAAPEFQSLLKQIGFPS
jgi:TolB-like protein/DNA-binding winged helix-turn-helix (wHTH) protein/lipopolysaccharide biosynthesis regulator YciM